MDAGRKRCLLRTIRPLQVARIAVTTAVGRSQVNTATMTVATFHRARLRTFDCCTDDWTRRLVKIRSLRRGSVALRVVEGVLRGAPDDRAGGAPQRRPGVLQRRVLGAQEQARRQVVLQQSDAQASVSALESIFEMERPTV